MRRSQRPLRTAILARVSREDLCCENQIYVLTELAKDRSFRVVRVYQLEESAWVGSSGLGLSQVLEDARRGLFQVLLVWSIDRISRKGPYHTILVLNKFRRYGVRVISHQERWLEKARGRVRNELIQLFAWAAESESGSISARTKAGMARAKAEGKHVGRPRGSRDKRPRKRRSKRTDL